MTSFNDYVVYYQEKFGMSFENAKLRAAAKVENEAIKASRVTAIVVSTKEVEVKVVEVIVEREIIVEIPDHTSYVHIYEADDTIVANRLKMEINYLVRGATPKAAKLLAEAKAARLNIIRNSSESMFREPNFKF